MFKHTRGSVPKWFAKIANSDTLTQKGEKAVSQIKSIRLELHLQTEVTFGQVRSFFPLFDA